MKTRSAYAVLLAPDLACSVNGSGCGPTHFINRRRKARPPRPRETLVTPIIATVLPIATPVPRVSVQLTQDGASVGTLLMTCDVWRQVWVPLLTATNRVTIHDHVPNPVTL
jgi:hypothetical protein